MNIIQDYYNTKLKLHNHDEKLLAQWLHSDHVLSTRERKLYDLQQRLAHAFNGVNTGTKWQQQDIEPGDKERDGPGQEPQ